MDTDVIEKRVAEESGALPKNVSAQILKALRRRKPLWLFLHAFCRAVENGGGKAYLTGGFVRDMVEGLKGNDIDLMVSGIDFERIGPILDSLPRRRLSIRRIMAVGKAFPVYKVWTGWTKVEIDIAPARAKRTSGTDPIRERNGDAREDAARRDFTINSLLFELRAEGGKLGGTALDYFGGIKDLRRMRIRCVGSAEERFREDPLRMLRAIRQKNERTGYSIERKTWGAICRLAPQSLLDVSRERVMDEILRSLSSDPVRTVKDLRRSGILRLLLPELKRLPKGHGARIGRRYALLMERMKLPLPGTILLANLLVDIAGEESGTRWRRAARRKRNGGGLDISDIRLPRTDAIARRLQFPMVRSVARMLQDLERLRHIRRMKHRNARIESIFAKWKNREYLLHLYEAASRTAGRTPVDLNGVLKKAKRLPPLVTGRRLQEIGIPEGPGMERILEEIREAALAGIIGSSAEAERYAKEIHGRNSFRKRKGKHADPKAR